jgi:hypothetical protein
MRRCDAGCHNRLSASGASTDQLRSPTQSYFFSLRQLISSLRVWQREARFPQQGAIFVLGQGICLGQAMIYSAA